MSHFLDVLFPTYWTSRAEVELQAAVTVTTRASGAEDRQSSRPWAARIYRFSPCQAPSVQALSLQALYADSQGPLRAFRFRDRTLWKSSSDAVTPSATDRWIGRGDGVRKRFGLLMCSAESEATTARRITRPVAGSVKAAINGVAVSDTAFLIDPSDGMIEFIAPPAAGSTITAGFRFDLPVRFCEEALTVQPLDDATYRVGAFSLREVLAS